MWDSGAVDRIDPGDAIGPVHGSTRVREIPRGTSSQRVIFGRTKTLKPWKSGQGESQACQPCPTECPYRNVNDLRGWRRDRRECGDAAETGGLITCCGSSRSRTNRTNSRLGLAVILVFLQYMESYDDFWIWNRLESPRSPKFPATSSVLLSHPHHP